MAKDKITEYDSVANNNTVVGDVNLQESSMLPSDVNNAIREVMSHQKEAFGSGTPLYVDQTNNRVGIGNSSPDVPLEISVAGSSITNVLKLTTTGSGTVPALQFEGDASGTQHIVGRIRGQQDDANDGGLVFETESSGTVAERMRISNLGNVTITGSGTGSTTALKVNNTDSASFVHAQQNIAPNLASTNTVVNFVGKELSSKNSGYIGYTWSSAGSNSNRLTFGHYASDYLMNLTADGNLLVGKTASDNSTVGTRFQSDGFGSLVRDGNKCLVLNRKTSDGEIIDLQQDGSTIGGIYSSPSVTGPFIGHINVGLAMYHAGNSVLPSGTGGLRDNAIDLGNSSNRFDDVFATNSSIQTSDRNEKQDIEELSEAEQRVAVVAKGLMRKYRWRDAVAEKGENARTHFGIIAQDLQDAFTAEGLDASDYAMFCSDTWWEKEISVDAVEADEENGIEAKDAYTYRKIAEEATEGYTEKTRLGVRYSELLAFIISAI